MTKVMMKLGGYKFSVSTAAYKELIRTTPHRWSEQKRINRRPALQYMGPGKETIELSGDIYPLYNGGVGQIDDMRAEAGTGEPRILVDGTGKVWGKWCIEEIRETQPEFLPAGIPKKQTFTVRLAHYGEDE